MAEPVTLQTLLTYLTLISVPVGVFYYISTLRNQNRARKTQLYLQMVNKFSQADMIEALGKLNDLEWSTAEDFIEEWRTPEGRMTIRTLANWYEGLGVLVKENLLDMRVVALLVTGLVIQFWDKFIPVIDDVREALEWPRFYIEAEYLYDQLMKYTKVVPVFQSLTNTFYFNRIFYPHFTFLLPHTLFFTSPFASTHALITSSFF